MHVLLTGATGKVASRTAGFLASEHRLRLFVRTRIQKEALESRGFDVALGDVTKPETLAAAVDGIDAIAHFAAFFRGATPEQMDAVNRGGSLALARAGLEAGVTRFLFASTSLVYGKGIGRPRAETDTPDPAFPYPASKLAAERALMEMHQKSGLDLRILRFSFVYGDGDSHLRAWLPRLRERPGDARFQLVHHEDAARAVGLALTQDAASGRIFNVADDEPLRISEIFQILAEPPSPDGGATSESDPWEGIMDTRRIRTEFGFRPNIPSLREAIAQDRM